jgi:hypothetical protein
VALSRCPGSWFETPNTLNAHRLIWLAEQQGVQDAVVEALFRAYFTEGRDIGNRQEPNLRRWSRRELLRRLDSSELALSWGRHRRPEHHR